MKSFYVYTFGCRVNEAEAEKISLDLVRQGWKVSLKNPDYYLINTCAVTAKAEREVRQHIYQVRKRLPEVKVVLTGCAATYWERKKNVPKEVDLVVSNSKKERLVDIIVGGNICSRDARHCVSTETGLLHNKFLSSSRAIFKIQEGCDRFCSYCITSYLRGKTRSTSIKDLLDKINYYPFPLQEVILAAINTAAYGVDTNESLVDLIKNVLEKTKINRLSFGSIHPWTFDKEFFRLLAKLKDNPRFVQLFHIPIQSGSNKILKLMQRDYSTKNIEKMLVKIKKIDPYAFIGTDIIVGFCGETEKEFQKTYGFLKRASIDKFHVFRFSRRPDTAAYSLVKDYLEPSEAIKTKRAKIIRDLGQKKYLDFLIRNIDRKTSALVIKRIDNEYISGLLDNQLPILIKTRKDLVGKIVPVQITNIKDRNLMSELIKS